MVSGSTAADVAIVLVEELGLEKAQTLIVKLWKVKGNKSFTDSMKAVDILLGLSPEKLLEIAGGKVVPFKKRMKARS